MKFLFSLIFTILFFCAHAQSVYKNNIATVKELNIYGKGANVIIGKIIVNNSVNPPSIKLLESTQSSVPDKDGFYFTGFSFGTNNVLPLYNVDLHLKFNHPVDSLTEAGISYEIKQVNIVNGLSKDKLSYSHVGDEVHAMLAKIARFVVLIKSKEKIETTITGVDAN
jgi:hypothetical protein